MSLFTDTSTVDGLAVISLATRAPVVDDLTETIRCVSPQGYLFLMGFLFAAGRRG